MPLSEFHPDIAIVSDDFPRIGLYHGRRVKRSDIDFLEFTYHAGLQKWLGPEEHLEYGGTFITQSQALPGPNAVLKRQPMTAGYYLKASRGVFNPQTAQSGANNYGFQSWAKMQGQPSSSPYIQYFNGVSSTAAYTSTGSHYEYWDPIFKCISVLYNIFGTGTNLSGNPGAYNWSMHLDYHLIGCPQGLIDTFDRVPTSAPYGMGTADSTQDWDYFQGSWFTDGTRGYSSSDTNLDLAHAEAGVSDFYLKATLAGMVSSATNKSAPAIIFRMRGVNVFLYAYIENNTLYLGQNFNGYSILNSWSVASLGLVDGTPYTLEIKASGQALDFWVNGTLITTSPYQLTAAAIGPFIINPVPWEQFPTTKAGLFLIKAGTPTTNAHWNDLSITSYRKTFTASLGLVDNFDKTASTTSAGRATTGQMWSAEKGTWGIDASGKAYSVSDGSGDLLLANTLNQDVYVSCDIQETGTAGTANRRLATLVARASNNNCYLMVQLYNGLLQLYKNLNGSFTLIAQTAYTVTDNTVYTVGIKCIGNTITLYVNSVLQFSYLLSSQEAIYYNNYHSTRAGIRLATAGTPTVAARWDNFSALPAAA